jgi:hypothetical protein
MVVSVVQYDVADVMVRGDIGDGEEAGCAAVSLAGALCAGRYSTFSMVGTGGNGLEIGSDSICSNVYRLVTSSLSEPFPPFRISAAKDGFCEMVGTALSCDASRCPIRKLPPDEYPESAFLGVGLLSFFLFFRKAWESIEGEPFLGFSEVIDFSGVNPWKDGRGDSIDRLGSLNTVPSRILKASCLKDMASSEVQSANPSSCSWAVGFATWKGLLGISDM